MYYIVFAIRTQDKLASANDVVALIPSPPLTCCPRTSFCTSSARLKSSAWVSLKPLSHPATWRVRAAGREMSHIGIASPCASQGGASNTKHTTTPIYSSEQHGTGAFLRGMPRFSETQGSTTGKALCFWACPRVWARAPRSTRTSKPTTHRTKRLGLSRCFGFRFLVVETSNFLVGPLQRTTSAKMGS